MDELNWSKEYVAGMFKLLRAETPHEAFNFLRQLQQLEEIADKEGKTVFLKADLIDR
jgi:hypothetical protein